jgi:hypothetical protein
MSERWSIMDGKLKTQLTVSSLATRLSSFGINITIAQRLCGNGAWYIHVLEADDFTLSRADGHGYRADAVCESARRMRSAASRISVALTSLKIRHYFSVQSGRSHCADYFHYRWPKEAMNREQSPASWCVDPGEKEMQHTGGSTLSRGV